MESASLREGRWQTWLTLQSPGNKSCIYAVFVQYRRAVNGHTLSARLTTMERTGKPPGPRAMPSRLNK